MSWCTMPLVIKVRMTAENYTKLLNEAAKEYTLKYLKNHFKYDGTYFSFCSEDDDDPYIYEKAKMVAKYAEPTKNQAGLIFPEDGGCSYAISDLYFENCEIKMDNIEDSYDSSDIKIDDAVEENRINYKKRKRTFLDSFPASKTEMVFEKPTEINTATILKLTIADIQYLESKLNVKIDSGYGHVKFNGDYDSDLEKKALKAIEERYNIKLPSNARLFSIAPREDINLWIGVIC